MSSIVSSFPTISSALQRRISTEILKDIMEFPNRFILSCLIKGGMLGALLQNMVRMSCLAHYPEPTKSFPSTLPRQLWYLHLFN